MVVFNSDTFSNNNCSLLSFPVPTLSFSWFSPQYFYLNNILLFFSNTCPTPFLLSHFPHQFCPPNHSSLCFCSLISEVNFASCTNPLQNHHRFPFHALAPGFLHLSFPPSSCFPEQLFPPPHKAQMADYWLQGDRHPFLSSCTRSHVISQSALVEAEIDGVQSHGGNVKGWRMLMIFRDAIY